MSNKIKALSIALAGIMTAVALTSCGGEEVPGTPSLKNAVEITLNGDTAACEAQSVFITDDKISITQAGTYVITGTLNDGQIYVDCVDAGEVILVLNNAVITNDDSSCIFIKKAQSAEINMMEGTTNTLSDGTSYIFDNPEADEPDAAIFSKEDLVISGNGTLEVNGNYMNGIVSKDALIIESGNIVVKAAHHGIKGKDYLLVKGGSIDVNAVGDGLKSTNADSELVGYVEITGGDIKVYSEDEAIQAVSRITFRGGTTALTSTNNGLKCENVIDFESGTIVINAQDVALDAVEIEMEDASVTIDGDPYIA